MDIAAFDAWRANYDQMSYADQQAFYDRFEAEHPAQAGYLLDGGLEHFTRFFEHCLAHLPKTYVLELGGWKGELAREMLNRFPSLSVWCNVEICCRAIKRTVFSDARYLTYNPPDQPWKVALPPGNVLVASHFIEHIKSLELDKLLRNLPATLRYAALVAPLPATGPVDWSGYHGSHILEQGWQEVNTALWYYGWQPLTELSHKDFRVFECAS